MPVRTMLISPQYFVDRPEKRYFKAEVTEFHPAPAGPATLAPSLASIAGIRIPPGPPVVRSVR